MRDEGDAEEILQEVFFELVEAYRLTKPIEQVPFSRGAQPGSRPSRKKKPVSSRMGLRRGKRASRRIEELLPSPDAGPEAEYARNVLIEELEAALIVGTARGVCGA